MKKKIALLLACVLVFTSITACGSKPKEERVLNVYSWDEVYPQEVLNDFKAETGITVNFSAFDSNETMLSKLEASKGGDYDVVCGDDYILEPVIKKGLAQEIDVDKLSNYGNLNPMFQGQYFDPDNKYTVPYSAGMQTIIYDPEKVPFEIKGFNDLLDPRLKDSIGMNNNMLIMMALGLIADGHSVASEDPDEIAAAGQKLMDMAPNIHAIKDAGLEEDLVAGEISVGLLYTNQNYLALQSNPNLKVVFPEEGVGYGTMVQFIPSNAPHAEEAYEFMNYLLRPEVAKKCTELVANYSVNKEADKLFTDEEKESLTIPTNLDKSKMQVMKNVSEEAMNQRSELWTKFKNATGKAN